MWISVFEPMSQDDNLVGGGWDILAEGGTYFFIGAHPIIILIIYYKDYPVGPDFSMSLKQRKNILLESTFCTEKKQFLNILKRIRVRYEHQSTVCIDINTKVHTQQISPLQPPLNCQPETHVPSSLLQEPRKSILGCLRDRRNCYNLYPLLEKQQMEKKLMEKQNPDKQEIFNLSPKQKVLSNFENHHRFPRLKQIKLLVSETPALRKVRREEQRKSTTVLCSVSKLTNTLKVNKKIINRPTEKKQQQKSNSNEKQVSTCVKGENKYSFYEQKKKNNWPQKITTFYNYSKHEPAVKNDLTSWNLEEDDTNSFQNLIF